MENQMTTRTYEEMNGEALSLYGEQRYADVLDLLNREGDNYPDHAWFVLYMRSCMAARIGEPELALRLLGEALDRGYWSGVDVMRQSPSWQTLQGVPEFEQLAEISIARQAEAQANSVPRLFTLEPEGGCEKERPCPLFLALHGNGENGEAALEGWQPVVSRGWLLAAIQSSQITGPAAYVWDDQDVALPEVGGQYAVLREKYAIDAGRTILTGYSMGGETALSVALTGTIPVRGFLLLGPGGPTIDTPEAWLPLIEGAKSRGLRGYMLLGENDDTIPHDAIRTIVTMLNDHGIPCELELVPGTRHQYPQDLDQILERVLAFLGQE
jgi:hypothetical protein